MNKLSSQGKGAIRNFWSNGEGNQYQKVLGSLLLIFNRIVLNSTRNTKLFTHQRQVLPSRGENDEQ